MRVFVSVDMEGIAGIVVPRQVQRGSDDYEDSCRLMVGETNAVVSGAFDAGADTVVVNDSHGDLCNLRPSDVDERALLQTGSEKSPHEMILAADDDFDAVLLIGYHARAGTPYGVLEHSFSGAAVSEIRVNGTTWGEMEIAAATCAGWGVPVVLVSGDDKICAQAAQFIPGVRTVQVKEGLRTRSARSVSPLRAQAMLRAETALAVAARRDVSLYDGRGPFTLELEFRTSPMADAAEVVPAVERVSSRCVRVVAETMDAVARYRCVLVTMAHSTL